MANPTVDELLSRIDINKLYPPFLAKVRLVLQDCINQGAYYYVTSGERTWEEQQALYNKGRVPVDTGRHVTNARPGYSGHNFAIAVDACRDADISKRGLQPDYTDKSYEILGNSAVKFGLVSGYFWTKEKDGIHDPPHIQLNIKSNGFYFAKLREIYAKGGKKAVFDFMNKYKW